jgi:hypothetical protein
LLKEKYGIVPGEYKVCITALKLEGDELVSLIDAKFSSFDLTPFSVKIEKATKMDFKVDRNIIDEKTLELLRSKPPKKSDSAK